MKKFKNGDKVKIINKPCCNINNVGDIGVITEITDGNYLSCRVYVEGNKKYSNWHDASDLELLSHSPNYEVY